MAGTVVLCLEDVLCKGEPPNGVPVWVGLQLYHALASQFRVVLDSSHDDITDIEHWLQVNGLKRHTLLLHRDARLAGTTEEIVRRSHLGEWRSQGYDIALYVVADPTVAAVMMSQGIPTLLFAHPLYARPEYRPDAVPEREVRRWDDIETEITEQLKLVDHEPRIDADMDYE